jgi:hypothetical protein
MGNAEKIHKNTMGKLFDLGFIHYVSHQDQTNHFLGWQQQAWIIPHYL